MTRTRVRFGCEQCGAEAPKWVGRCAECGEWGTVVEVPGELLDAATIRPAKLPPAGSARAADSSRPTPLADVDPAAATRRATGVAEFDRVLSGGLVPGSVTLLGGEPGVGKSTLLLQALVAMAEAGARVLLVAAEESAAQVRLRAERLGPLPPSLFVLAETSMPYVLAHAAEHAPDVLVVDSIQTVHDPDSPGVPGSVAQVRDSTHALVRFAKDHGTAVVLVGHVTKDGTIAGPRVLEHVVDTVLHFEGERNGGLRLLRALKHRFGRTDEIGLFEMSAGGLVEVDDASAMLLADRLPGACGSVVVPMLEGARPLLVEVQALVAMTNAPVPRRQAQALDGGRVAMLAAVLHKRGDLPVGMLDLYASVVGGVRLADTGSDLGVVLAVASSLRDRPLESGVVALGEVGLGGEVRSVPRAAQRLAEAARIGFSSAIVPRSTPAVDGIKLLRVADVREALDVAFAAADDAPGHTTERGLQLV
jgi:DNA repair protein RadA/Sms